MRLFSCIMMNIQFKDEFDGFLSPDALKQGSEKAEFPLEGLIVHHT